MNLIPPRPTLNKGLVPPLHNGDHLTQAEFHRRYEVYPKEVKAELIGGRVFMASPLRIPHGENHANLSFLLNLYRLSTKGLQLLDNATTILGEESEPQPDLSLLILPAYGGQSRETPAQYVGGAPELIAEIAHSSVAIDLHDKRDDYRQAGVVEYLVVCVEEQEVRWLHFPNNTDIQANRQGVAKSVVFPGLWLDVGAFLEDNMPQAMAVMQQGLACRAHATFVKRLAAAHQQRISGGETP